MFLFSLRRLKAEKQRRRCTPLGDPEDGVGLGADEPRCAAFQSWVSDVEAEVPIQSENGLIDAGHGRLDELDGETLVEGAQDRTAEDVEVIRRKRRFPAGLYL